MFDVQCILNLYHVTIFCSEYFFTTPPSAPRRGRKKPVTLGQVGVRCMSCACAARKSGATEKRNGATYYPTTIASIYNSVMLIQQRHFSECKAISAEIRAEYSRLKLILGRSGAGRCKVLKNEKKKSLGGSHILSIKQNLSYLHVFFSLFHFIPSFSNRIFPSSQGLLGGLREKNRPR